MDNHNGVIRPFRRKAAYYETDKMGIVHHSNYIRWLEEARVDLMEQASLPFTGLEEAGITIPVVSVSCTYRCPVHFDDEVEIHPMITEFNGCKFRLKYEIVNLTQGRAISAVCETSHCFVNMAFRPIRTQRDYPHVYETFAKLVNIKI
ncbi:MAG: thioesterase family protein [Oscillospiraceae bacterium]